MSNERRRYFRIEDTVSFTVSTVDPDELQTRIDNFWDVQPVCAVRNQLDRQLEQQLADFKVIEEKMPELARYLTVLQAQIENITTKLLPEQTSAYGMQKVNISGQGMSYISVLKLTSGGLFKLCLVLF